MANPIRKQAPNREAHGGLALFPGRLFEVLATARLEEWLPTTEPRLIGRLSTIFSAAAFDSAPGGVNTAHPAQRTFMDNTIAPGSTPSPNPHSGRVPAG